MVDKQPRGFKGGAHGGIPGGRGGWGARRWWYAAGWFAARGVRGAAGRARGTTTPSRRQAGAGATVQHHNPFHLTNIYCDYNSFIVNSRYTRRAATVKQPV